MRSYPGVVICFIVRSRSLVIFYATIHMANSSFSLRHSICLLTYLFIHFSSHTLYPIFPSSFPFLLSPFMFSIFHIFTLPPSYISSFLFSLSLVWDFRAPCMSGQVWGTRRRVHLATALLRTPSGHRPSRRQARHAHIPQNGLHLTQS